MSAEQKSGQHVLGLESVAPELLSALSTQYLCGIELFLRYYRFMRVIHNDISEVQTPDIGFILQDVSHARPRIVAAVLVRVPRVLQFIGYCFQ